MQNNILIIGAGSVTQNFSFCLASKTDLDTPCKVFILSRSQSQVDAFVSLYNSIACTHGTPVTFEGDVISWDDISDLKNKIIRYQPSIVFHTATLQSPWEFLEKSSTAQWKTFIENVGNGFVIPLLTVLVKQVAEIMKNNLPNAILVNACFPDNVNPILSYLSLPVSAGIGNIGMLTAITSSLYQGKKVQAVGHLYQVFKILGKQHSQISGPRVWIDGEEIQDVERNLRTSFYNLRNINSYGKFINQLVGSVSVELILGLLSDQPSEINIPGPNGLPGGYPVKISRRGVELNLPTDCTEEEAIQVNKQGAYDMGSSIIDEKGFIYFSETSMNYLKSYQFPFTDGFHINQLSEVVEAMLSLRDQVNNG